MTIHLRTHTDSRGDAVDYSWFCSRSCYLDSLRAEPATVEYEEGGAYPCGAEHDMPDFCATCEQPVGNPLTDEGYAHVQRWLMDQPFLLDPTGTNRLRADALRNAYPMGGL